MSGQAPFWIGSHSPFPPVELALREPNGLLAVGGDLTPARLLRAYQLGIFPWYSPGQPILWWSPDPRMLLRPPALKISRSLAKTLRKARFEISLDRAFESVILGCAAPRDSTQGTWITKAMQDAYIELHRLGYAHSVEAWQGNELVGGLYGVALGRVFYGESMFTRVADASKVAFVHLVRQLQRWAFPLIDCQVHTGHLERFGAYPVPRADFIREVQSLAQRPTLPGPWQLDADIAANW